MKTTNDIPPYLNLSLEDMDGEVWKDVVGTDGSYSVSNFGRVKSNERMCRTWITKLGTSSQRIVKPKIRRQHVVMFYYKVNISYPDGKRLVNVHRLVAEAFLPNPDKLPCINHKDEDKLNNCVDNLEWCSYIHNNNYGTRNARISKKQRNNPLFSKRVAQFDMQGNLIKEWDSICDAGRAGYDRKGISRCCRNMPTYNTSGGYKWKFI